MYLHQHEIPLHIGNAEILSHLWKLSLILKAQFITDPSLSFNFKPFFFFFAVRTCWSINRD